MKENICGRKSEIIELESVYNSKQAEFVVIYGRRRVGKTFLIRELYEGKFAFCHTALSPFEMEQDNTELLYRQQLRVFGDSLQQYGDYHKEAPADWIQAFQWLRELLVRQSRRKRLVVFLDELPWMDTPRSGFVTAFEHFWNGWGAGQRKLMLIVCGSASSWINDKLLNNTSGLYGRTTHDIHIAPFNLLDCEQYFSKRRIVMDRYDLLQCYMIMGGIPYYMSYFKRGHSLAQNIDNMFFANGGSLRLEFDRLFQSLFTDAERYKSLVRLLGSRREGYTRKEIVEHLGITSGGGLTKMLESLEASDFIIRYNSFASSARGTYYKLIDMFSLFYLFFVEKHNARNTSFWQDNLHSPQLNAWRGISFEEVCYSHIDKIKSALGISGVHCEVLPWRSKTQDDHTQIDMLINRDDRVVNICEIKYCAGVFTIDKDYDMTLMNKVQSFVAQTSLRKNPHLTVITTYGLKQNQYSGHIQNVVTMDDFFRNF